MTEKIIISEELHKDLIETLERTIILLEDNPKIKDVSEFYDSEIIISECNSLLNDLKSSA